MNMSRNEFLRRVLAIIEDESVTREDLNTASAYGCVAMRVLGLNANKTGTELSNMGLYKEVTTPNDNFVAGLISRREFHDAITALLEPEDQPQTLADA